MTEKCRVYIIESTSGHYKIGISSDVQRRLKELQKTQGPYLYDIAYYWVCSSRDEARFIEGYLHRAYDHKRVNGEWFELSARDLIDLGHNLIEMARDRYRESVY